MFLEVAVNYLAQQLSFQDVITLFHQDGERPGKVNEFCKGAPLAAKFGFYIRSSTVQSIEANDKPLYINQ